MLFTSIQTRVFKFKDNLLEFILDHVKPSMLSEKDVLFITSKIVSLAEGRLVPSTTDKATLVKQEADLYLGEINYGCHLTIKHGHLLISAGIDESNSENGDYILLPEHPFLTAQKLRAELATAYGLKDLGVVLTDSRTSPLRKGVCGIALAYAGFEGVMDRVGDADIFGRQLKATQSNVADALAATAVLGMGEGAERTPIAILNSANLNFTDRSISLQDISYEYSDDLYAPFIKGTF